MAPSCVSIKTDTVLDRSLVLVNPPSDPLNGMKATQRLLCYLDENVTQLQA